MRLIRVLGMLALVGCGIPFWHTPPQPSRAMSDPPRSVADIASVAVYHGGCFGTCPVYHVGLARTGIARYEGVCFVPVNGVYEAALDSATFAQAAAIVLSTDFFRSDTLIGLGPDMPTITITVVLRDGRRRTVRYGQAWHQGGDGIERLVASLPWHYVGPSRAPGCAT